MDEVVNVYERFEMLGDRKAQLITKMIRIFNHHKLNKKQIERLLRVSAQVKYNRRTNNAVNQLADMLLEENLSIQEGCDIITGCYETLFGKNH